MGTRCADHVTHLYPQKLALTSPTGGGRSIGIVRVRTKATEFSLYIYIYIYTEPYLILHSIPDQSMWGLWRIEWHWDGLFSKYLSFTLLVSFY